MKRVNKKAISDIVSTVLIIMIAVAAVGVIGAFVIPMIRENLSTGTSCLDSTSDLYMDVASGFSCYDGAGFLAVQLIRGQSDLIYDGAKISVMSNGSSYDYSIKENFQKGSRKTFYLDVRGLNVEKVFLYPLLSLSGGNVKQCDSNIASIPPMCSLAEQNLITQPEKLIRSPQFIDPDLILHLKFDREDDPSQGVFFDSSLYANHFRCSGTICPSIVQGEGPSGKDAAYFDGNNTLNLTGSKVDQFKVASKTISFWAKPSNVASGHHMPLSFNSGNYYVSFYGSSFFLSISNSSSKQRTTSWPNTLFKDSLKLYTLVIDSNPQTGLVNRTLYINGAINSSIPFLEGYGQGYGSIINVGSFTQSGYFFNGTLSDMRIYKRALTAFEIAEIYDQTK